MNTVTDGSVPGRRYRGVSNEARRAERQQKFLVAGLTCFARDGFHQTTVRGICGSAGLTERYFYESFTGMEDLFRSVYLDVSGQVRARVLANVSQESAADLARFSRTAMHGFFQSIQDQPDFVPILFQEALSISREMTRLALATLNEFVDLLMAIGQPAFMQQSGVKADAGLISAGLVGGIMHMAVRWAEGGFALPIDDVVDNAMLIFDGLLRQHGTVGR